LASSLCSRRRRISRFRWLISRRANYKNPPELLLVLAIAPLQRIFTASSAVAALLLFLCRQPKIVPAKLLSARDSPIPDDSGTLRASPLHQTSPDRVRRCKQRDFILDRPFRDHVRGPSSRAAASKNLASSFLVRQPIPASEHLAHACAPSVASFSEKLGDEIARHSCPVSSGGPNIVDRLILAPRSFFTASSNDGSMCFPVSQMLRFIQAQRNRRDASQRESHIPNRAVRDLAQGGEANLGNGCALRVPTFLACGIYPENRPAVKYLESIRQPPETVCL